MLRTSVLWGVACVIAFTLVLGLVFIQLSKPPGSYTQIEKCKVTPTRTPLK